MPIDDALLEDIDRQRQKIHKMAEALRHARSVIVWLQGEQDQRGHGVRAGAVESIDAALAFVPPEARNGTGRSEREAFETWYIGEYTKDENAGDWLMRKQDGYDNPFVNAAWQAWLGRAANPVSGVGRDLTCGEAFDIPRDILDEAHRSK